MNFIFNMSTLTYFVYCIKMVVSSQRRIDTMQNNWLLIRGFVVDDARAIDGKSAAKFSVGVDRYQPKNGDKVVDFFNVSCWNDRWESVLHNVKKGQYIQVEARLNLNRVDEKVYPELVLSSFLLLQIPKKAISKKT